MHTNLQSLVTGKQLVAKKAGLCGLYMGTLWPAEIQGSAPIGRKKNGYWKPAPLLPVGGDHGEAMTAG